MNIDESLIEYGFSSKQAKIYAYLLSTVEANVFDIAQDTQIARTTAYTTLEHLRTQGIVSSFKKNGVLFYTPANPQKLVQLLKDREAAIESVMPQLKALIDSSVIKPSVQLYEGAEGVKIVYEDILETLKKENIKVLYAAGHPELIKHLPKYFPQWVERREALGTQTYLIVPISAKENTVFGPGHNRNIRYMPDGFPFQCSMDIYGSKIAMFSFKGNRVYSIILESATITEMFKQFFLFTWEGLARSTPA